MTKSINNNNWIYILVAAIILLPTLSFPISSDLSVFMHGGEIIANGGGLFNDFFDIKPPLIYYLFACINLLFGDNVVAYRLFDFIYQIAFLSLSSILFTKLSIKNSIIRMFLVIFPLSYTVLNYRDILQTESLAFIPLLLYFYYLAKNRFSYRDIVIMGIVLGVSISLKYTLGILFLVSLLLLYKNNNIKEVFSKSLIQLLIAFTILSFSFLPIAINGNLDGLIATNKYLVEYAKYPPLSGSLIRAMLNSFNHYISSLFSITFTFFFLIACFFSFKEKKFKYINILLLSCLLLFISVVIEKKINIYHITRMYPFLILLVSYGAYYFFSKFKFRFNIASIVFIGLFLLFSPLPRLLNAYKIAFDRVFRYEKFVDYYSTNHPYNLMNHHILIADYVNKRKEEKFLFLNTGGNQAVHYLNFDYRYKFPHSAFHLSPYAPELYTNAFEEDLWDANLIVIDNSDDIYMIFLTEGSSYDLVFANPKYKEYIESNFKLDTILLDRYFVYSRGK